MTDEQVPEIRAEADPADATTLVYAIVALVERMDAIDSAPWPTDEAITVWDLLDNAAYTLRAITARHGRLVAARLGDDDYEHPQIGKVHGEVDITTHWDGDGVLSALGRNVIEPDTGELIDAVPLDTLRRVLPAVSPGKTSSKWNRSGLRATGIQPEMYSETDYGARTLRRGPKYRRRQ